MLQLLIRIIYLVVALGVPYGVAYSLKRNSQTPYTLAVVGLLTASSAFLTQTLLTFVVQGPLLDTPFFGALILALIIGFTDGIARFWGYYAVARAAVNRPQAMMIGLGHGLPLLVYQGLVVAVVGGAAWRELGILLAQLILHMGVSWVVLQTFVRNEIGWVFQAVILIGLAFGTDIYIANTITRSTPLLIWWGLLALLGIGLLAGIRPFSVNRDQRTETLQDTWPDTTNID